MTKTPLTKEEVEQYMNTEYTFNKCHNFIDIVGQKFGKLTVLKRVPNLTLENGKQKSVYLLKCDCGNYCLNTSNAIKQKTKSCGCNWVESITSHKMTNSITYTSWDAIIQRCTNSNNHNYLSYRGRGITVCDRWLDFNNFLEDMGERVSKLYSIERLNNNLGYFKENCKWATSREQSLNKRSNVVITYKDKTQTLTEWCDELKLSYKLVQTRIKSLGWNFEQAITVPKYQKINIK